MNTHSELMILVAVLLPPMALDLLGEVRQERIVETPYGPFGPIALRISPQGSSPQASSLGNAVWIGPYTGLPSRTDPRATLYAAKELGVKRILSWDTGVALDCTLSTETPCITCDYIDWTRHQPNTFYTDSPIEQTLRMAATVQRTIDSPFCPQISDCLQEILPKARRVTYLGIDGPRGETVAEARMFRQWGADILGQNLLPEAMLAREIGICFGGLVSLERYGKNCPPAAHRTTITRTSLEQIMGEFSSLIEQLNQLTDCDCVQ